MLLTRSFPSGKAYKFIKDDKFLGEYEVKSNLPTTFGQVLTNLLTWIK